MKNMKFKQFVAISMATAMVVTSMHVSAFAEGTVDTETPNVMEQTSDQPVEQTPDQGVPAQDGIIYTYGGTVSTDADFPSPLDWTKNASVKVENTEKKQIILKQDFNMSADVIIDEAGYQTLVQNKAILKVKGAVEDGTYKWTEDNQLNTLARSSFEKTADGYRAKVEFSIRNMQPVDPETMLTLDKIHFILFGDGFKGKVSFTNVQLTDLPGLIYMAPRKYDQVATIDETAKTTVPLSVVKEKHLGIVKNKAKVTGNVIIDEEMYKSLQTDGTYLRLQTNLKIGEDYKWNTGESYICLTKKSFNKNKDGEYEGTFSDTHSIKTEGCLQEILVQVTDSKAKGSIRFSKLAVYNPVKEDNTLPERKDPTVIDNFDSYTSNEDSGWVATTGKDYDGQPAIALETINDSQALKLGVDYTKYPTAKWSEANVKKSFQTGYDVSLYNMLTYDVIYPEDFSNFRVRLVAKDRGTGNDIFASEATVGKAEKLNNGMVKSKVSLLFKAKRAEITDMTISMVGVESNFKGNIYIDNITLQQDDPMSEYAQITSKPMEPTYADISNMPASVALADCKANDKARTLYAYLKGVSVSKQVLFGHQNDTNKSAQTELPENVTSDVEYATGSISAVNEINAFDIVNNGAVNAAVYGRTAAEKGAVVALTLQVPNMNSANVKTTEGEYDFSACTEQDAEDMTGNGARDVLPSGKKNDAFKSYLNVIADYAKKMGQIPVLCNLLPLSDTETYWWGTKTTDAESYRILYRYAQDYLSSVGVHNFIYVYDQKNVESESKYLDRYPGDDYVDILGFELYDIYNTYPASYTDTFITKLKENAAIIKNIAEQKGKIAALTKTGANVAKEDETSHTGLLIKGNPMKGKNWFKQVSDTAKENGIPYFVVGPNKGINNFYVPYKYNDKYGHEMINEFIDYYNDAASVFANGTNYYNEAAKKEVAAVDSKTPAGYIENISSNVELKEATPVNAYVRNAEKVQVVLKNEKNEVVVDTLKTGSLQSGSNVNIFIANLDVQTLKKAGKTNAGKIVLRADGKDIFELTGISLNQDQTEQKKPGKITGIKTKVSATNVQISWKAVKSATGYQIERYNASKKKYVKIATTKKTKYIDKKCKAATKYQYRICAYTTGDKTPVYGVGKVIKVTTAPAKVKNISAKRKKSNVIEISWKKVSGANGYEVYRSEKKNGKYKRVAILKSVKKVTFMDKKVKTGKKYFYTVRAFKTVNKKALYGVKSNVISIVVKASK